MEPKEKNFSISRLSAKLSERLAHKGNVYMASLTLQQRKSIMVAVLMLLSCYFVFQFGNGFFGQNSFSTPAFPAPPVSNQHLPADSLSRPVDSLSRPADPLLLPADPKPDSIP